jgi:hypothetical protein
MLSTVQVEVLQRPRLGFPFVVEYLGLESPVVEPLEADPPVPLVPEMVAVTADSLVPPVWRYLVPRQSTGV